MSRRPTPTPLAAAVVCLVALTGCQAAPAGQASGASASSGGSTASSGGSSASSGGAAPTSGPTGSSAGCLVAAAGDVAGDDYRDGAKRTADLIAAARPQKVLVMGDLAYDDGTAADFADYYDPTWGAFKAITAPAPGNHDYHDDGKGYFDYFDVPSNYAFDLCGWRVVSVDQYASMRKAAAFIEAEGRRAGGRPLLAYWHEPRFSSGSEHGTDPDLQPLWAAAVAAGAEIVLNGHDHNYERFEPLDADGQPRADGTVEFVAGTGGHNPRVLGDREAHSAVAIPETVGVLFLTLRADGYDWSYRDVDGGTRDSGTRQLP